MTSWYELFCPPPKPSVTGGGVFPAGSVGSQELPAPSCEAVEVGETLDLFKFGQISENAGASYPADEFRRINTMAWELMQVEGMTLDMAINVAAGIILAGTAGAAEVAKIQVAELCRRMRV